MTLTNRKKLEAISLSIREEIVRLSSQGGSFIGASLSCVDILTYLYAAGDIRIKKDSNDDQHGTTVLLSKGHAVPALYATLSAFGILDAGRLKNHLSSTDSIYWHPNSSIPGIEFHSGSLGHLLSVGLGIAMDGKYRQLPDKVIVIVGDGELNEGSVWEALLVASAKKLDNLCIIVDRNQIQANVMTEDLTPLEPLSDKFRSFGIDVIEVNGHSFDELEEGWNFAQRERTVPSVIIAHTIRGKGIPSIEGKIDRWFMNLSESETALLLQELHSVSTTDFVQQQAAEAQS